MDKKKKFILNDEKRAKNRRNYFKGEIWQFLRDSRRRVLDSR